MSAPLQPLWKKPFHTLPPDEISAWKRSFFDAYNRGETSSQDLRDFQSNLMIGDADFQLQAAARRRAAEGKPLVDEGLTEEELPAVPQQPASAAELQHYRIGAGQPVRDLPGNLQQHLRGIGGDYEVRSGGGAPEGYSRLAISSKALGFTGRNAMVIDVRGGPESAYQSADRFLPAIMLRLAGAAGSEAEVPVGMKLVRNPERGWQRVSPIRSLADIVAGSFMSAMERRTSPWAGQVEDTNPSQEMFSLLTVGQERHELARRKHGIPEGHVLTYAGASQGEQIHNALNIGVAFGVDRESEETPFMQLQRQRDEIMDLITLRDEKTPHAAEFASLYKKGFFGFERGDDKKFHLQRIAEARLVNSEPEVLVYGGGDNTDWLRIVNRRHGGVAEKRLSDLSDFERIEGSFKHLKAGTMVARSRYEPTPMVRDERGRLVPVQATSIQEQVEQHGERYWEDRDQAVFVRSGIILPGEKAPRLLQVANVLAAKIPIQGGGFVDPSLMEGIDAYGTYAKDRTSLSFESVNELLDAEFSFGDVTGASVPAQLNRPLSIGKIVYGAKASLPHPMDAKERKRYFAKRTQNIAIRSRAYDVEAAGGTLILPRFYDPFTAERTLYSFAEKRGDKYFSDSGRELRLVEEDPEIQALADYLSKSGISVDYSSPNGAAFETRLIGEVGAAFKAGGAIKMGGVLFAGRQRMHFQADSGERVNVGVITGETKQPIEMMMASFATQSFDNRLRLLELIGKVEVEGRGAVDVGARLRAAAEPFKSQDAIPVDALANEFADATGLSGATWANVFGAMFLRVRQGENAEVLKHAGIRLPGAGKFYGGYAHPKTAEELAKSAAVTIQDSDNPNFKEVYGQVQAGKAMILPVGLEAAVEWPATSEDMNLDSVASFEHNFPALSKALSVTTGSLPAANAGLARRGWLGMIRSYMFAQSAASGERIRARNVLTLDDAAVQRVSQAIEGLGMDDEVAYADAIQGALGEDVDENTSIFFPKGNAYLPTPGAVSAADLIVPTAEGEQSRAHMLSQYIRAFQNMVDFERFPSKMNQDAYMRFIGAARSRLGEALGPGTDVNELLTRRVTRGAVGLRYFGSLLLGPGEGMAAGWQGFTRIARSMGARTSRDLDRFSQFLSDKGDTLLAAFQRDPVISDEFGTTGVRLRTPAFFEKLGILLPKAPWATGAYGLSLHTTLPMQGDYDFDPGRLISGAILNTVDEEYQDKKGRTRTRRTAAYDDAAIRQDLDGVPFDDPEYARAAVAATMQNEAGKFDIIQGALGEMESGKSPLDAAKLMGYVRAQIVRRALEAYWSGVRGSSMMIARGTTFNEAREMKAAVAMQRFGGQQYLKAMRSFVLRYQKSLEYNLQAGQEPQLAAVINRAKIQFGENTAGAPVYGLRTLPAPPTMTDAVIQEAGRDNYKNILEYSGPGMTGDPRKHLELAYSSAANAGDITDDLLAAVLANTGEDPGVFQQNYETIYGRLQEARASTGLADEAFRKQRWGVLSGELGGENLYGSAIGTETPLVQLAMSSALEKARRGVENKQIDAGKWHAAQMMQWRGQWYSLSELYNLDEFSNLRVLRSLQTGSTRDETSPLPTAGEILRLSEQMRANTPLTRSIHAMRAQLELEGYEKDRIALSSTQIENLHRQLPKSLRASNISAILSATSIKGLTNPQAVGQTLLHDPYALRPLIDTGVRNLALRMGKNDFPLSIFESVETAATQRGHLFEEWLEEDFQRGEFGIRAPQDRDASGRSRGSFSFVYTDSKGKLLNTTVVGTPDFMRLTPEGRLEIIEAKHYQSDPEHGFEMAAIQGNFYREGIINLARGIGRGKNADEVQSSFRQSLREWAYLANQQRKERGLAEFDWKDFAEKAAAAAQAGNVDVRAALGGTRKVKLPGGGEKEEFYLKNVRIGGQYYEGDVPVNPVRAETYLRMVHSIFSQRDVLASLYGMASRLIAGGRAGRARVDTETVEKAVLENRKGETTARVMSRGVSEDFLETMSNLPGVLMDREAHATIPETSANDETTLVKPGEKLVSPSGEKRVILGDETQRPGDRFTVAEVKRRRMAVPEWMVKRAAALYGRPGAAPQENERIARLLMTKQVGAKAGDDEIRTPPLDAAGPDDIADLDAGGSDWADLYEAARTPANTTHLTPSGAAPAETTPPAPTPVSGNGAGGTPPGNTPPPQPAAAAPRNGGAGNNPYMTNAEKMSPELRRRKVSAAVAAVRRLSRLTVPGKGQSTHGAMFSAIESRIRQDLGRLASAAGIDLKKTSTGMALNILLGRDSDAVMGALSKESLGMLAAVKQAMPLLEPGHWKALRADMSPEELEGLNTQLQEAGFGDIGLEGMLDGPMESAPRKSLQQVMPLLGETDARGLTAARLQKSAQPDEPKASRRSGDPRIPSRDLRKRLKGLARDAVRALVAAGLDPKTISNEPDEALDSWQIEQTDLQSAANQMGKPGLANLRNVAARARQLEKAGAPLTPQLKAAVELSGMFSSLTPEHSPAASQKVDPLSSLTSSEMSQLYRDHIQSMNRLKDAVVDQTKVTKESLEDDRRSVTRAETLGDVTERKAKARGYERAAQEVLAGRRFEDLTPDEQRRAFGLTAKAHEEWKGARREELQAAAAEMEGRGSRGFTAQLSTAAHRLMSGFSLFYLQRAGEIGLSSLYSGYQEREAYQRQSWQTMNSLYGPQPLTEGLRSQFNLQRAAIRAGNYTGNLLTDVQAAMTGTAAGDVWNAGKFGVSAGLGTMFLAGGLGISAATAGAAGLVAGAGVAMSYPVIQGLMAAREPVQTGMKAASLDVTNPVFPAAPGAAPGAPEPQARPSLSAGWQLFLGRFGGILSGRWGLNEVANRADPVSQAYSENQAAGSSFLNLAEAEKTFANIQDPLRRKLAGDYLSRDFAAMTPGRFGAMLQTIGMSPDQNYFSGVSIDSLTKAGSILKAGGTVSPQAIRSLAEKLDAGVNEQAAWQALQVGKFNITNASYTAAVNALPATAVGQQRAAAGLQFANNFSAAYIDALGYDRNNAEDMTRFMQDTSGKFFNWAASRYAQGIARESAIAERYGMYDFNYAAKSGDEITGMDPEERRKYMAKQGMAEKAIGAYESTVAAFGEAGIEIARQFMDTIKEAGTMGAMAGGQGMQVAQQAFFLTGGNMNIANGLFNQVTNAYLRGNVGLANQLQGAISGDPVALQMQMLQNPQLVATMRAAGFSQVADVNRSGQVTGLPLYTTHMTAEQAQQVWGQNWQGTVGQHAVQGYTPGFASTQTPLYGIRAIQAQQSDAGYLYQQQMFGFQRQQIGIQQQYMTQSWALDDKMRLLRHQQALWGFQNQLAGMDLQRSQFYENQALNRKGSAMSRAFAQWEWGRDDQLRDLKWQWRQEDFGEEVRFMTGRQRRLAERQMKRDTIVHNLEEDRVDKQREQQLSLWKLEDERFALQKKHFEQDQRFQRESIEKQRQFYLERHRLEEQQVQLQRRYQQQQIQLQQQQLRAQQQYAQATHKAQTEMTQLSQAVDDAIAGFKTAWQYTDIVKTILGDIASFAREMGYNANTGGFPPAPSAATGYVGSGAQTPGHDDGQWDGMVGGTAGGGSLLAGEMSIVGENGPELIRAQRDLFVQASSHRNPWQKAIEPYKDSASSTNGPITLVINLGDEQLFSRVIRAVSQEIEV